MLRPSSRAPEIRSHTVLKDVQKSSDNSNRNSSAKETVPIIEIHKPVIKTKERYGMLSGERYLSSRTYYNSNGKVIQSDDFKADGTCENTTKYERNDDESVWVMMTTSYSQNNGSNRQIKRELDDNGRVKVEKITYGSAYGSDSAQTTIYEYDNHDNIITETTTVADSTIIMVYEYDYNTNGEKVREKIFRDMVYQQKKKILYLNTKMEN